MSEQWEVVSSNGGDVFKFTEVGQSFVGTLTGIRTEQGRNNKSFQVYDFEKPDGSQAAIFGGAQFDESLPGLKGRLIKIVYDGSKTTKGGNTFKAYTIAVAPVAPAVAATDKDDLPF